ncbi:myosin-11 isoform X1 [Microcaecilia unicolor]|uniref:Myosin-11-like isoform X1 n=1 Tax=Microcaecilia unicolor TaxID=1415580 RepID=A0A6P7X0L7_9AMPH|nr:myosin-11-like isoform X1 [Microcaecilia unicolor]
MNSKMPKTNKVPNFINLDSLTTIETEYIKNLQKQVYLLELETSFLREQAKKATNIPPKITSQAEKVLAKMKVLQSEINTVQLELNKKENGTEAFKAENEILQMQLQSLSDANTREKLFLIEDVTNLKKLNAITTHYIAHKEAELAKIQQELWKTISSVKDKEHNINLLETQLHHQIQQHQSTEAKLVEKRSEFLRLQTCLHQLEEKYSNSSQSMQDQISKDLRKEADKLRQQLKEKELSADEDKYLCNKIAEKCEYLTKENGFLRSQVLENTNHLQREQQLRLDENNSQSRRISELASEKEKERHFELMLSHLKRLVQDESQKVLNAHEQLRRIQQGRRYGELNGQSLQNQLSDLKKRHSRVQLENSQLRTDKAQLVEHISQLHKKVAKKEEEIRNMHGHINSLSHDLNNMMSQVDMDKSLQQGGWKEFVKTTNLNESTFIFVPES